MFKFYTFENVNSPFSLFVLNFLCVLDDLRFDRKKSVNVSFTLFFQLWQKYRQIVWKKNRKEVKLLFSTLEC